MNTLNQKQYDFATEGFIIMFLSKYQILQQQELDMFAEVQTVFNKHNPSNIYFILKRPRTTVIPESFIGHKDYFQIDVNVQIRDQFYKRTIEFPHQFSSKNIDIKCEYPNNYFTLRCGSSGLLLKTRALLDILQYKNGVEDPQLDYEVLYIGQSFGTDGNSDAIKRLSSHSTLQSIYSKAITNYPDSEIWLMPCSFQQKMITSMHGHIRFNPANEAKDFERFMNFPKTNFSDQQRINFTEAALIKTFQPPFNKEYKNTFPNPAHSSYSECYDMDLNGIGVETDLSEVRRWIYTDHKKRGKNDRLTSYWQAEKFYFVNSNERYKMFNNDYL